MTSGGQDWQAAYATRAERMKASEIRELLKLLDQPDVISFAGGIPDPVLFPSEAIADAYARVLADPASTATALQYSVSEGYLPLREWIVAHMARLGVPCTVDNIVVTSGSQQALDFIGKLFLSPGDTALVAAPTYMGALGAFNAYEPRYDTLDLGDGNRTPDSYRAAAAQNGGRVKFAYLVPDFSNPTGITVPLEKRTKLLELAENLGAAIVEDSAYQALSFGEEAIPSVLALDVARSGSIEETRTLYLGTFSKTLAPALRVGWVCAAKPVIQKLVLLKQAGDLHTATINQMVMHKVASTVYEEQVARIVATYSERCANLLSALDRYMPAGVTWTKPEGGMFVWVTLPEGMDGAALLAKALTRARVAFVPGRAFYADGVTGNVMRLSFSLADKAHAEQGIRRLAAVIESEIAAGRSAPSPDRPLRPVHAASMIEVQPQDGGAVVG